jgi:hypothetical protein
LVSPFHSFGFGSFAPRSAKGKYHRCGDRVVYGWSSSEVAFMGMHEISGACVPQQLVREKLLLPVRSFTVATFVDLVRRGVFQREEINSPDMLVLAMQREGVLGVWVESVVHAAEYVLVLNAAHHAINKVSVVRTQLLTNGIHY